MGVLWCKFVWITKRWPFIFHFISFRLWFLSNFYFFVCHSLFPFKCVCDHSLAKFHIGMKKKNTKRRKWWKKLEKKIKKIFALWPKFRLIRFRVDRSHLQPSYIDYVGREQRHTHKWTDGDKLSTRSRPRSSALAAAAAADNGDYYANKKRKRTIDRPTDRPFPLDNFHRIHFMKMWINFIGLNSIRDR